MKYIIITVCVLILSVLIKERNKSISVFLSFSGIVLLLITGIDYLKEISEKLSDITSGIPTTAGYLKITVKALLITVVTQIVSDICRDNGENALASSAEIVSKCVVVIMVFPLFETVLSIVNGLVK